MEQIKKIEIVTEKILDNNPGISRKAALEYASVNIINKKKKTNYFIY